MHTSEPHDPHLAGEGAVVLDIGGDVGALIVVFPDELVGREVEIVPADPDAVAGAPQGGFHAGEHHPEGRPPHVGIVPRPMGAERVPTAVFGDLVQGRYRLSLVTDHHHEENGPSHGHSDHPHEHGDHPHEHTHEHHHEPSAADDVLLDAEVVGGEVTTVTWPVV